MPDGERELRVDLCRERGAAKRSRRARTLVGPGEWLLDPRLLCAGYDAASKAYPSCLIIETRARITSYILIIAQIWNIRKNESSPEKW